jgi:hypothetical protein
LCGIVRKRVNGWNGRPLSMAREGGMLKSVARPVPTYVTNCFELPISTWSYVSMFVQKSLGGVGFLHITLFIDVMVRKQCCQL